MASQAEDTEFIECAIGMARSAQRSSSGAPFGYIFFWGDIIGQGENAVAATSDSTAPILAVASHLIAHNEGRLGKTLRSGHNDVSDFSALRHVYNGGKLGVLSPWFQCASILT